MKNKIVFLLLISFAILSFFNTAYADTTIHLDIKTPTSTLYNQNITVAPCNSDNNSTFTTVATAYCAIRQSGIQNDWNWAWAPGAFLNSLGNLSGFTTKDADDNDVYHYWSWSLNGVEGATGLNQYELQPGDLISLNFIDPPLPPLVPSGGGGVGLPQISVFIPSAFSYLRSVQSANGSFGNFDMYTDWAAIAYGAAGILDSSHDALLSYFYSHAALSSLLTDNERRSMALLALGQNPYSFNGINYIDAIVKNFDGTQFGDQNLINDDIFALIPLVGAGYTPDDDIIARDIQFIISKQKNDGSWEESIDMTAAAIQALQPFNAEENIASSIIKAGVYIANEQGTDGGWNNVFSTSWAVQAMNALNMSWTKNGNNGLNYLAAKQEADGAILSVNETLQNRIWATSSAIPATLGKSWSAIMHPVPKMIQPIIAKKKIPAIVQISQVEKKMLSSPALSAVAVENGNTVSPLLVVGAIISVFALALFARSLKS
jgi:hypothetical protein